MISASRTRGSSKIVRLVLKTKPDAGAGVFCSIFSSVILPSFTAGKS